VVASLEDLAADTVSDLRDKGFEVVAFIDESAWPEAFQRLLWALGRG
jgi:hypothetical protein